MSAPPPAAVFWRWLVVVYGPVLLASCWHALDRTWPDASPNDASPGDGAAEVGQPDLSDTGIPAACGLPRCWSDRCYDHGDPAEASSAKSCGKVCVNGNIVGADDGSPCTIGDVRGVCLAGGCHTWQVRELEPGKISLSFHSIKRLVLADPAPGYWAMGTAAEADTTEIGLLFPLADPKSSGVFGAPLRATTLDLAVGDAGSLFSFKHGSGWTMLNKLPTTVDLRGVWGVRTGVGEHLFLVGGKSPAAVDNLYRVAVTSTKVTVAGAKGPAGLELSAVWSHGGDRIWVLDGTNEIHFRSSTQGWTTKGPHGCDAKTTCAGVSNLVALGGDDKVVWAVGEKGSALRYDAPGGWKQIDPTNGEKTWRLVDVQSWADGYDFTAIAGMDVGGDRFALFTKRHDDEVWFRHVIPVTPQPGDELQDLAGHPKSLRLVGHRGRSAWFFGLGGSL